jgi:hypothetical protein
MLDWGFWHGLLSCFESPRVSSPMLPVQGALVFYFFGPARLNALTLIFAYFALLQVAVVYAVRRLTGSWHVSLLALALLIATGSRFLEAGGLSDFRADGVASSMYGLTLCCFLLSDWMRDGRWSWVTVWSAVLLCWLRPIAGVYLAVALLPLLFFTRRDRLRGLARYAEAFAALTLPMVPLSWQKIYTYYIVGHVVGPEKSIRALEQGIHGYWDSLLYYPRSLANSHLGLPALALWACLLVAAGLLAIHRRRRGADGEPSATGAIDSSFSPLVLILWMVSPLAILTLDESKSAVVASVAVTPAVLLGVYVLCRVQAAGKWLITTAALLAGMTIMADAEGRKFFPPRQASPIKALFTMYKDLAAYCEYFELREIGVATDRTADYFSGRVAAFNMFERTGLRVRSKELLAHDILEQSPREAEGAAQRADVAMVTLDPLERVQRSLFPFDRSANRWQASYQAIIARDMIPLGKVSMPGHDFQIFVRPRVRLEGDSGGWITADGFDILTTTVVARTRPLLKIRGITTGSAHLKGPLKATVAGSIPGRVTIGLDEAYEIEVDLSGAPMPDERGLRLHVAFDRYFIPQELGLGPDPRKLVLLFPKSVYLASREGAASATSLSAVDLYP